MIKNFLSLSQFWRSYVPTYKSGAHPDVFVRFPWGEQERSISRNIRKISERRSTNRITSYVDPREIDRVRQRLGKRISNDRVKSGSSGFSGKDESRDDKRNATKVARDVSIRFGVSKSGHGYGKERGDFCLVSAVLVGRKITFFYRSIELIGGLAFDLVLIEELERLLGVEFTQIDIWAKKAFIFALKGNSNQKLYPKLREIMRAGKT